PSAEQQAQQARRGQSAELLDLNAVPFAKHLTEGPAASNNQKLGLLAALLKAGDWDHAVTLMRWLRALGVHDFGIFPDVGAALCALAARELDPLYRSIFPHGYVAVPAGTVPKTDPQAAEGLQLPARLLELLRLLGVHLYHDVALLTRLARVAAAALRAHKAQPQAGAAQQAQDLLTYSVLPALSLLPSHIALVFEAWDALSLLPYAQRFAIYGDLRDVAADSPLLIAASKLAETEVRRILRRVTAPASRKEGKAAMRPLGRALAKIMHAQPIAVCEQLLRQVMGMPGMVGSIVESLRYITPMAADVMVFAILKQLASPKKKLKGDGVNLEEWFQWLAAFTGLFCKKNNEVELSALLQYVANQLKATESLDLLVLREILFTMTGIQAVFEVSDTQLDALAGSEALRTEVVTQGEHRASNKSLKQGMQRLTAALRQGPREQQLALPLLILLAQQRKLITLTTQSSHLKLIAELYDKCQESSHLKLIAELYDKCQEVLTQYAEFLRHALPAADYQQLLPSLQGCSRAKGGADIEKQARVPDLAQEYLLDPEVIFELYRPVLRQVEPPSAPPLPDSGGPGGSGAGEVGQQEEGELPDAPPAGAAPAEPAEGAVADGKAGTANGDAAPASKGTGQGADDEKEDGEAPMEEEGEVVGELAPTNTNTQPHLTNGLALEVPVATDPLWPELEKQVQEVVGQGTGLKAVSPTLYLLFWSLSLYDLEVPAQRYEQTIAQLTTSIRVCQDDLDTARRDAQRPPPGFGYGGYGGHGGFGGPGGGRGPPPPALEEIQGIKLDPQQLEKELERYKSAMDRLPGDLRKQQENAARILQRLERTKAAWIVGDTLKAKQTLQMDYSREFVQHCILPRLLNSPSDALYCATFMRTVHKLDVPGFSLLHVLQLLFREVGFLVRCCTSREATNLGIFFNEVLSMVDRWRSSEVYARECIASHTFWAAKKAGTLSVHEFKKLTNVWQEKLTDEVFRSCLEGGDYMQMKNALLVLNRCVKVYPAIRPDAESLLQMLAPVRDKDPREDLKTLARMDKDPREDLKTLARMYCTALEMQMRDSKNRMHPSRDSYAGRKPKHAPRPASSAAAAGAAGTAGAADREGGKTPTLPPGLGVKKGAAGTAGTAAGTAGGGEGRQGREVSPAGGPPPGFGSSTKLAHAASTSDVGKAEQAKQQGAEAAAQRGRERERDRSKDSGKDRDREKEKEKDTTREKAEGKDGGQQQQDGRPLRPTSRVSEKLPATAPAKGAPAGTAPEGKVGGGGGSGAAARREGVAGRQSGTGTAGTAGRDAAAGTGAEKGGEKEPRPRSGDKDKERGSERDRAADGKATPRPPRPTPRSEAPPSGSTRGHAAEKRPRQESPDRQAYAARAAAGTAGAAGGGGESRRGEGTRGDRPRAGAAAAATPSERAAGKATQLRAEAAPFMLPSKDAVPAAVPTAEVPAGAAPASIQHQSKRQRTSEDGERQRPAALPAGNRAGKDGGSRPTLREPAAAAAGTAGPAGKEEAAAPAARATGERNTEHSADRPARSARDEGGAAAAGKGSDPGDAAAAAAREAPTRPRLQRPGSAEGAAGEKRKREEGGEAPPSSSRSVAASRRQPPQQQAAAVDAEVPAKAPAPADKAANQKDRQPRTRMPAHSVAAAADSAGGPADSVEAARAAARAATQRSRAVAEQAQHGAAAEREPQQGGRGAAREEPQGEPAAQRSRAREPQQAERGRRRSGSREREHRAQAVTARRPGAAGTAGGREGPPPGMPHHDGSRPPSGASRGDAAAPRPRQPRPQQEQQPRELQAVEEAGVGAAAPAGQSADGSGSDSERSRRNRKEGQRKKEHKKKRRKEKDGDRKRDKEGGEGGRSKRHHRHRHHSKESQEAGPGEVAGEPPAGAQQQPRHLGGSPGGASRQPSRQLSARGEVPHPGFGREEAHQEMGDHRQVSRREESRPGREAAAAAREAGPAREQPGRDARQQEQPGAAGRRHVPIRFPSTEEGALREAEQHPPEPKRRRWEGGEGGDAGGPGAPGLDGIPDRLRARLGLTASLPAPAERAPAGEGAGASGELRRSGSAAGGGGREAGEQPEGKGDGEAPPRGRHSRVVYEEAGPAPRERRPRR
ncbi:hypothetical protein N2152v2_000567, partial [Parachlorella kessleri]